MYDAVGITAMEPEFKELGLNDAPAWLQHCHDDPQFLIQGSSDSIERWSFCKARGNLVRVWRL